MKAPNGEKKNIRDIDDDQQEDEEEDRKPPAKEIHVPSGTTNENNADEEEDDNEDTGTKTTAATRENSSLLLFPQSSPSAETSVASVPNSVGWTTTAASAGVAARRGPETPYYHSTITTTPSLNDKNQKKNRSHQQQQQSPPTPALVTATPGTVVKKQKKNKKPASESSVSATAMTTSSSNSNSSLHSLQRQIYLWLATVSVGVIVLIVQVVPATVLTTVLFLLVSTGMMVQTVVRAGQIWYDANVIRGRGLGHYLPSSLYGMLTQTTLHDYLSDGSTMEEYQHLLLYFMPLTTEQLQASLQRIAPRHRERLFRPGLGHLISPNLMRMLLGDAQYQQIITPQQQLAGVGAVDVSENDSNPNEAPAPPQQHRQRLLLYDDDDESSTSDLGLDISGDDMAGGLNEAQARTVSRRLHLTNRNGDNEMVPAVSNSRALISASTSAPSAPTDDDDADETNYADVEMQVLIDAFTDAVYSYVWYPTRDYMSDSLVVPTVSMFGYLGTQVGLLMSVSATGLGLFGWWSGVYALPTSRLMFSVNSMFSRGSTSYIRSAARTTTPRDPRWPPSWTVWTTAAMGGATVGLSLLARRYIRQIGVGGGVNDDRTTTEDNTKRRASTSLSDGKKPPSSKK